jgi:hypothetical protein
MQSDNTIQFDTTLRALAARATLRYPDEQRRIDRGLGLALNGHVTLQTGGTATVQSGTDPEIVYHVGDGRCDCDDFWRAPGGRCKHRLAVALVRKAHAQAAPPAPTRIAYHATFRGTHGTAIRDEQGRVWFRSDDDQVQELDDTDRPHLHLHGRMDLAAAQRGLDLAAGTDLTRLDSQRMAE